RNRRNLARAWRIAAFCRLRPGDALASVLDGGQEPISPPGQGLNVPGRIRIIPQGHSDRLDAEVEPVIEIYDCVPPDLLAQFIARNHLTRACHQKGEDARGLRTQTHASA